MLSNLLSDSFRFTYLDILQKDTRNKLATFGFGANLVHNVHGCSIENHPQRPFKEELLLKIRFLNLGVILTQPLFTVSTLCKHLSISRATLYRLINKGEIEPIRIGSLTRFTDSEVERFLTRQQKQARIQEVGF
jgi:excisionase family DNA binding protein